MDDGKCRIYKIMIQLKEYKDIDKKKWDACIDRSPDACIFVYSFYLDAVCESWSALVLNDYEAVFPLVSKSKFRIHYLYQPFFTRYFGVFSKSKATDTQTHQFLNAIPEKYKYIEFCIHEGSKLVLTHFSVKERCYQVLDLKFPYETVAKAYSDNAKRNIKKASKAGFRIEPGIAPEEIVKLFRRTKGAELKTFKVKDFKTLLKLMNELIKEKKAETLAVYNLENQLCAAAFFIKNKNRFVYLKSGVSDFGKNNGAMHFLFDFFIKNHSGGDNILDFGGSSVESVARFYKNFGAKDCVYLQLKKNRLPNVVKWVKGLTP